MNEVKRIHLGRQAFTIAVDAHAELREYIAAIKKHVGSQESEVVEEVELRMAELLHERKITDEKVILQQDVAYLKEQLGSPKDFADGEVSDNEEEAPLPSQPRQLFRDTENGKLGGVSAGLAAYFGVDVTWVRIGFVLLTLAWGGGVVLYLLMWLIVPEAKTGSDYLRLRGKPVTVDTIKEFVDQADMPNKAKQASSLISQLAYGLGKLIIVCTGLFLSIIAAMGMLWTIALGVYAFIAPDHLFDAGRIFPVETREYGLIVLVLLVAVGIFALLFVAGVSMIRRKWIVPGWAMAGVAAIIFVSAAVAIPLGAAIAPEVRDRYKAAEQTTIRSVKEFKALDVTGSETVVRYEPADTYAVEIHSVGSIDKNAVKTEVQDDGTLMINTQNYRADYGCSLFCLMTSDVEVVVKAPKIDTVRLHDMTVFKTSKPLRQSDITLETHGTVELRMEYIYPSKTVLTTSDPWRGKTLELSGLHSDARSEDTLYNTDLAGVVLHRSDSVAYTGSFNCEEYDPIMYIDTMPSEILAAGQTFTNQQHFSDARTYEKSNAFNCILVR